MMEILEYMNPWWKYEDWEKRDKHLKEWNSQDIKWVPKWINDLSLEPFSLNFIIGPRQVGKTTGIKLLIKKLIEDGKSPDEIIYLNVEIFGKFETFLNFMRKFTREFKEGILFLDEVTSIDGWEKVLKAFIDMGMFENFVITCSGSSTANILRSPESFMGRRGKGKDIVVLPLDFKSFLEVHGVKIRKSLMYSEDLFDLFEKYVNTGGFPRTINGDFTFYEDFIREIKHEIKNLKKSFITFSKIISTIFDVAPSPVSYSTISQRSGISKPTVEEYLELSEDMLITKIVYWKDHDVLFRKEKKIIIRDPAVAKSLSIMTGKELRKDFLYEWIVQEHLYRKFGEIYYYKNSYEIDAIAGNLKVEVKAGKPHRKYPKNVIVLEEEDIPRFLMKLFEK